MKTNVLKALLNLRELKSFSLPSFYTSSNRINSVGDALEYFVKDIFCDSLGIENIADKEKEYAKYLSYLGNANNPPDFSGLFPRCFRVVSSLFFSGFFAPDFPPGIFRRSSRREPAPKENRKSPETSRVFRRFPARTPSRAAIIIDFLLFSRAKEIIEFFYIPRASAPAGEAGGGRLRTRSYFY